jgi:hypothetical protein
VCSIKTYIIEYKLSVTSLFGCTALYEESVCCLLLVGCLIALHIDPVDGCSMNLSNVGKGRAIAEAVSCWLPTAAARVQSRIWSSGICGGQSGVGAGFLLVLRFPLPFIPPNSPSSQSPGAGTIVQ